MLDIEFRSRLIFGVVTNLIGAVADLLRWPLRQPPRAGSLAHVFTGGTGVQIGLMMNAQADTVLALVVLFFGGRLLHDVASALHFAAGSGRRPRNQLTIALSAPIWLARTLIEVTAGVTGRVPGRKGGGEALALAFAEGPPCGWALPFSARPAPSSVPAVQATPRVEEAACQ